MKSTDFEKNTNQIAVYMFFFLLLKDACQRSITTEDTHDLCVIHLRVEHTQSALEGTGCAHCDTFKRDRSQATAACSLDLAAAEIA